MLTGKCKEDFDKWLAEHNDDYSIKFGINKFNVFEDCPFPMQYGVIIDFFDSNSGLVIGVHPFMGSYFAAHVIMMDENGLPHEVYRCASFKNRLEARQKAIEESVNYYNKIW